ncbi:hypothetical protein AB0H36_24085 [Kribbella sp. NPDC050820]
MPIDVDAKVLDVAPDEGGGQNPRSGWTSRGGMADAALCLRH